MGHFSVFDVNGVSFKLTDGARDNRGSVSIRCIKPVFVHKSVQNGSGTHPSPRLV